MKLPTGEIPGMLLNGGSAKRLELSKRGNVAAGNARHIHGGSYAAELDERQNSRLRESHQQDE
jgi:hypothetical protein